MKLFISRSLGSITGMPTETSWEGRSRGSFYEDDTSMVEMGG